MLEVVKLQNNTMRSDIEFNSSIINLMIDKLNSEYYISMYFSKMR